MSTKYDFVIIYLFWIMIVHTLFIIGINTVWL